MIYIYLSIVVSLNTSILRNWVPSLQLVNRWINEFFVQNLRVLSVGKGGRLGWITVGLCQEHSADSQTHCGADGGYNLGSWKSKGHLGPPYLDEQIYKNRQLHVGSLYHTWILWVAATNQEISEITWLRAGRLFGPREKPPWRSRKLGFYIKPFIPRRVGRSLCFQTPWVWMYDWTPKTIPSKHRSFWRGMTGRLGKERSRFFELVSREEWSSPFWFLGNVEWPNSTARASSQGLLADTKLIKSSRFLSGKLVAECDWKNGKDSHSLKFWYIWNECPPIIVPIMMASLPFALPKMNGWNWWFSAQNSYNFRGSRAVMTWTSTLMASIGLVSTYTPEN